MTSAALTDERDRTMLYLWRNGHNTADIAAMMSMREHEVDRRLWRIRQASREEAQ